MTKTSWGTDYRPRLWLVAMDVRVPHRHALTTLVALATALGALTVTTISASAARGRVLSTQFGSPGSAAGQLEEPNGIALNGVGDIYVADTGNHRVDEFTISGEFVLMFGKEVNKTKVQSGGASEAEEDICTETEISLTAAECQTGAPGSTPGAFQTPAFVAVDESPGASHGDVYVADTGTVLIQKFTGSGELVTSWGDSTPAANGQLAGTNGPEFPFSAFGSVLTGVGVDPSGNLWVSDTLGGPGVLDEFSQAGTFTQTLHTRGLRHVGIALDGAGNIYVSGSGTLGPSGSIEEFTPTGTDLGPVSGGGASTGLAVDQATGDAYLDVGTSIEDANAACLPSNTCETFGPPELKGGTGLAVDPSTNTVYAADSAADTLDGFVVTPPGPPIVESESVTEVTADSAAFSGSIDPKSLVGDTEYWFEYGPCASPSSCSSSPYPSRAPLPSGSLNASFEPAAVGSVPVQGLVAYTTYHFRLVAENAQDPHAPIRGEERLFVTQAAGGGFVLPDGRQYEMVSPPNKLGALIEPPQEQGLLQAAAEGGAITYLASTPTESELRGYTNLVQVLSTRTPTGWRSADLTIPHISATTKNVGHLGQEFRLFSEDLSAAAVQPFGAFTPCASPQGEKQPCLSAEAEEQSVFLRNDSDGTFLPLVTRADDTATPFQPFGEECPGTEDRTICGPRFRGATPDLRHVVLESAVPLTETPLAGKPGLYEYSAGQLALVSVLPEGVPASEVTFGEPAGAGEIVDTNARNAISDDGSRIVFTAGAESEKHLYLRENATRAQSALVGEHCTEPAQACTVQLDTGLSGDPLFQTANRDVSKVFFSAGPESDRDLYEYNVEEGTLVRLTSGAGMQGTVLGASEDGSYLYFVADGKLAQGAVSGTCGTLENEASPPGSMCNLYVLHGLETRLVAVISAEDQHDWGTPPRSKLNQMPTRAAPDGQWLAFMSSRALTGYDNRDVLSGKPDAEVYLYDAGTGALSCASCDPTGARPVGVEYGKLKHVAGGTPVEESETWVAATVPGWLSYEGESAVYQPRYLSDTGRLFFNSSDALVPLDVNGAEDVYEFEPEAEHACSPASASASEVFKPARTFDLEGVPREESAGCVALISSGTSLQESAFMDASETGDDVFFLTAASLAQQDYDTSLDVYDAHVCTPASPCIPAASEAPPACTTEASCKPSPTPQPSIYGPPSSATFSGPGNLAPAPPLLPAKPTAAQLRAKALARALKACKKDKKESKRVSCEKTAHKKYGATARAKKASHDRRVTR